MLRLGENLMKASKLLIIFLSLLILVTACSNNLSNQSIEVEKPAPISDFKKETVAPPAKAPQKAYDIANIAIRQNGVAPKGYKGGRTYYNSGRNGEQILPKGNYKEYDINPYIEGQNRGAERIVIRNNTSVWYTNDHYKTFTQIK
jgi:guanyl-specific ribonuclease Sa